VYLLRRLGLILPVALISSILIFLVLSMLPGDVVLSILGDTVHTEEMRDALRDELGLNDPLVVRYGRWLWSMLNGEFGGESPLTGVPTRSLVARDLPVTLLLTAYSLLLSVVISVPLGVLSTIRPNRVLDSVVRMVSLGGIALPHVWIALVLLLALLKIFHWSPPIIYSGPLENAAEHFGLMVWPVLLLSWQISSHLVRAVRAAMLGTLTSMHIRAARARGLPEHRILWVHSLKPTMIPLVTVIAMQAGTLVGGALVLEVVFGIPGIGRRLVESAVARDIVVVQSIAFLLVALALALSFAADIVYVLIDPRVRVREVIR